MSCDKLNVYRNRAFSELTPVVDFFTFRCVCDLISDITAVKDQIIRCRTVGILKSFNGHHYLSDIGKESDLSASLLISMTYYKAKVPSCVLPSTVQLFGTLQWLEMPVLFVKIIQVLSPPMAIRLNNAITSITNSHLAKHKNNLVVEDYLVS